MKFLIICLLLCSCSPEEGTDGIEGPQGEVGPQGPRGPAGPQGPQGATGAAGPQGIPGIQGPAGAQGPQGIQGQQGIQGIPGQQGAPGPQGLGMSASLVYENEESATFTNTSPALQAVVAQCDDDTDIPLGGGCIVTSMDSSAVTRLLQVQTRISVDGTPEQVCKGRLDNGASTSGSSTTIRANILCLSLP